MSKIKQLSQQEAQKIAAGQVVERPANIVKELIENSIDAGATHISLYIQDGGKQLIRIVDNGCGMDADDAQLCFSKHATSKITAVDQLDTISTFGFRGEALPSIAAVSKVTLITKTVDTNEGIKLEIADSVFGNQEIVAAPIGTDITVRDLFYNIPARQKFLKKRETEWRHILQLVHAFCLSYPSIHFRLFSENKLFVQCPPVEKTADRFAQLFDTDIAQHMLPVDVEDGITITGAISNHQYARYDRNGIFFFVNNRWIKDFRLNNALIKGYSNVLPQGKYPMAALALAIDSNKIDVNVHPRKEEVAFERPRIIQNIIKQIVKHTLEENLSKQIGKATYIAPVQSIQKEQLNKAYTPFDFDAQFPEPSDYGKNVANKQMSNQNRIENSIVMPSFDKLNMNAEKQANFNIEKNKKNNHIPSIAQQVELEQLHTSYSPHTELVKEGHINHKILGQFNLTYILIEKEDGLFLVDQHAAHERIMYELFAKRFEDIPTINLMFPQLITLTIDEISLLEPHLEFLTENGIGVELFGENQIKIQSTPVHLKNESIKELIQQLIGWITHYKKLDKIEFKRAIDKQLHAQMACKAAVKAGDQLTHEQMEQLLIDLDKTENKLTCPHGRPTGFLLSMYDIEKKFKRKL